MRVLLFGFAPEKCPDAYRTQIQEAAPDFELIVTRDREEIVRVLDDIEITACIFPHDLITHARHLRWYQLWSAGADWLLRYPEVAAHDVMITTTSGIHVIQMCEHLFALVFGLARGLQHAIRRQSQHHWKGARQTPVFELAGKTLLLIGVGVIGERAAAIAQTLGMRVLGIRRNPAVSVPCVDAMYGPQDLLTVLPQADIVVSIAPLTQETRHMIGERELRAMRSTAYFFNIGRGATVDEPALIRALQEGWIAGAGLDVFETEPLPESSPLWAMDNVILTDHYGGVSPHYDDRAMAVFVENLKRYTSGQPLLNLVDKQLGY